MCRILSLVAAPMRRTRKNYVDGTPLRNETRLRVAGNGLLRSRASSPRFVPCVLSRSQRDSSHSAWPSTNTEVPSSLFSPLPPPNLFSFSPYTFFFVSSYLFFLSLSLSLFVTNHPSLLLRRECIQTSFESRRCRGDRCSSLSILSKMTHAQLSIVVTERRCASPTAVRRHGNLYT